MARCRNVGLAFLLGLTLLSLTRAVDTDESFLDDSLADDDDPDAAAAEQPLGDDKAAEEKPDVPATIDPPGAEGATGYNAPARPAGALFFDDFQSGLDQWTSAAGASGRFAVGQGAKPTFVGDRGLIIPQKARSYALSAPIQGGDDISSGDFVVQYEVKLEDGMTCGGAYVKLPTDGFPGGAAFDNSVTYSLMFGPDKCGSTSKVHVIFQSLNPTTKEYVEHHLTSPPDVANTFDKKTHLYSLAVRSNGTVTLSIDGEVKKTAELDTDFEPPFQPAQEIDDKDDKQPEDWVTEQKIPDAEATKPDDWDEDAPEEIPDEDAKMPEGWLEDEELQVRDPAATKPDEWDDEEDGVWEAPMIANPKCEEVGCGPWMRPTKVNPAYKGKWNAPMIDNPSYVGEWKPRKIPNPAYYELEKPTILPVKAIGFEIWTMDQGVIFDNLLVGTDIDAAAALAAATFEKKSEKDKEAEKIEQEKADELAKKEASSPNARAKAVLGKLDAALSVVEGALAPLEGMLAKIGAEPIVDRLLDAGISRPLLMVVSAPLAIIMFMIVMMGGGKKESSAATEVDASVAKKKKEDITAADDDAADGDDVQAAGAEGGAEPTAVRRRRATAE